MSIRTPLSESIVPSFLPLTLRMSSGTSTRSRNPDSLASKYCWVPVEGQVIDLASIQLVLAGGVAAGVEHGLAGHRIETEVVPDVGDRHCALVRAALGEDTHRRVAGAIEGQHTDDVVGAVADLVVGLQNRLQAGGAGLLHVVPRRCG